MGSDTVSLIIIIESLGEKYSIREIAYDRWGAVQMVQNIEGMGLTVPLPPLWCSTVQSAVATPTVLAFMTSVAYFSSE